MKSLLGLFIALIHLGCTYASSGRPVNLDRRDYAGLVHSLRRINEVPLSHMGCTSAIRVAVAEHSFLTVYVACFGAEGTSYIKTLDERREIEVFAADVVLSSIEEFSCLAIMTDDEDVYGIDHPTCSVEVLNRGVYLIADGVQGQALFESCTSLLNAASGGVFYEKMNDASVSVAPMPDSEVEREP